MLSCVFVIGMLHNYYQCSILVNSNFGCFIWNNIRQLVCTSDSVMKGVLVERERQTEFCHDQEIMVVVRPKHQVAVLQ